MEYVNDTQPLPEKLNVDELKVFSAYQKRIRTLAYASIVLGGSSFFIEHSNEEILRIARLKSALLIGLSAVFLVKDSSKRRSTLKKLSAIHEGDSSKLLHVLQEGWDEGGRVREGSENVARRFYLIPADLTPEARF